MNDTIIKDLNEILAGTVLGKETIHIYYERASHPDVKETLKDIEKELNSHIDALEMHIKFLDGNPNDSLSLSMVVAKYMEKLRTLGVDTDKELIKKTIEAMEMGVVACNKFLSSHHEIPKITSDLIEQLRSDYAHMDKQIQAIDQNNIDNDN